MENTENIERESKIPFDKLELLKWVRNISVAVIVVSFTALIVSTVLFELLSSKSPKVVPVNAILPWLAVLLVSLMVFIVNKRVLLAKGRDTNIATQYQNLVIYIAVALCAGATVVPALWYAIYSGYIFTIEDSTIGWLVSVLAIGAASVAIVSAWKKTSTLYLALYFTFNFVLFSVFTIFVPMWLIVVIPSLLGMNATIKVTSRERRLVPRFKSKQAIFLLGICLGSLAGPAVTALVVMPAYTNTYTIGTEKVAKEIEISFTWANATNLTTEALDALKYIDAKENQEVSISLPLIYRLKGNYDDDKDSNGFTGTSWDVSVMVEDDFETIEDTPIDEVDQLHYVDDGLVENFTRDLYNAGIVVDFMPLLPKEVYFMYINDATIVRFLKTWAITREFINRTGLGELHRGIIIDTERDYSEFDQVIANWWNQGLHEEGRQILTDLLTEIRQYEIYWKTDRTWAQVSQMSEEEIRQVFDTELLAPKKCHLSCATFQYHLDDFIDFDDEQQHFYEISVIPPTTWDYVGVMTYDLGANSEHNFYGYCRAIDYFFGVRGVPYLYSEDAEENIVKKFRIAQNYGYELIGLWALTSEYCFYDWEAQGKWCGGYCDRYGWAALRRLADALADPQPVTFEFDGSNWYKWTYMHLLQLVDLYLVGPSVYGFGTWPLAGAQRIRFPN